MLLVAACACLWGEAACTCEKCISSKAILAAVARLALCMPVALTALAHNTHTRVYTA